MKRMKRLILRIVASRWLSPCVAVVGSLFLTKELLYGLLDHFLAAFFGHIPGSLARLAVYLSFLSFYFVFFFLLTLVVFWVTNADDLIRKLTLKVIRDPTSYFVFTHKYILDRFRCDSTFYAPSKFFDEIKFLLEVARERFRLPHKRSISFLLGIDYITVKRSLDSLRVILDDNKTRYTTRNAPEIKERIAHAREELSSSLIDPLKCLDYRKARRSVIGNSFLDNITFLLELAAQPSYERALKAFQGELTKVVHRFAGRADDNVPAQQCKEIRDEASEIVELFRKRNTARIGFPIFSFIDKKVNGNLTANIDALKRLELNGDPRVVQIALQGALENVANALSDFRRLQDNSIDAFDRALSQHQGSGVFSPEGNIICLYGYSKTVTDFLKQTIKHPEERRWVEIILIKTDGKATTSSEENTMRNELLEEVFSNLTIYSFLDLLTIQQFKKRLNFMLGFEVINSHEKKAVFHFGAGQLLRTLITRLQEYGNDVHIYLIGARYKDIMFELTDAEVENSSVFDYGSDPNCLWVHEGNVSEVR